MRHVEQTIQALNIYIYASADMSAVSCARLDQAETTIGPISQPENAREQSGRRNWIARRIPIDHFRSFSKYGDLSRKVSQNLTLSTHKGVN